MNASSASLSPATSGLFINPITQTNYSNFYDDSNAGMLYNFETKEITYSKHRFSKFILDQIVYTTTLTTIPILSREFGNINNTTSNWTFPEDGYYRINVSATCQVTNASGTNNRTQTHISIFKGSKLIENFGMIYNRNLSGIDIGCCTFENILFANANDTASIVVERHDNEGNPSTRINRGIVIIERLN